MFLYLNLNRVHMCNQIPVITGVGVTISLQYYLCLHLSLNINVVKFLKLCLLYRFNPDTTS